MLKSLSNNLSAASSLAFLNLMIKKGHQIIG